MAKFVILVAFLYSGGAREVPDAAQGMDAATTSTSFDYSRSTSEQHVARDSNDAQELNHLCSTRIDV